MKMINAIINKRDAGEVRKALTIGGYQFTVIATTGGFMKSGNTTLLIGTDDDKVTGAIDIIRQHCASRMELAPVSPEMGADGSVYYTSPAKIQVGGATVFVTDVVLFEKM